MNHNIVILTGSGISQESGIQTFRASDGTWNNFSVLDVATPRGFQVNPNLVHQFYNDRRQQLKTVKPNRAHDALAKLESQWTAGRFILITQNVDDLHERAGSKNVLHLHGSLLKTRCVKCRHVFTNSEDITTETPCPRCAKVKSLRPDIVWFEEIPLQLPVVYQSLKNCSLFLSIGTSGVVQPAASFVDDARVAGAHTVELNLEKTEISFKFEEVIFGPATQIVPPYVDKLFAEFPVHR